jgi:hypothetical protein
MIQEHEYITTAVDFIAHHLGPIVESAIDKEVLIERGDPDVENFIKKEILIIIHNIREITSSYLIELLGTVFHQQTS